MTTNSIIRLPPLIYLLWNYCPLGGDAVLCVGWPIRWRLPQGNNKHSWVVSVLSTDTDHETKSTLTADQPFMLVWWINGWFRGAEPELLQLFLWASECMTVNHCCLDRTAVEHLEAFWHMYLWQLRGFSQTPRSAFLTDGLHRRPLFFPTPSLNRMFASRWGRPQQSSTKLINR